MDLEEVKKLQNVFKPNLNEISRERERYINQKSKKVHWKILNCFTNHEKLLLSYLMIILQLHLRINTKQIHEKRIPSMSTRVARGGVAKVSNRNVSNHSNHHVKS